MNQERLTLESELHIKALVSPDLLAFRKKLAACMKTAETDLGFIALAELVFATIREMKFRRLGPLKENGVEVRG